MSKAEADREYVHDCEWCGKVVPCSKQDWDATEGYGAPWFCCKGCDEAWDACDGMDEPDEDSPRIINEDDPRVDR